MVKNAVEKWKFSPLKERREFETPRTTENLR